jgi:hypothetical protein
MVLVFIFIFNLFEERDADQFVRVTLVEICAVIMACLKVRTEHQTLLS